MIYETNTNEQEKSNGNIEPQNLNSSGIMSKSMAHQILNMVKAGLQIKPQMIDQALITTGDL
jgi:predicted metal-dependent HD superfamily phosphohydrolase